MNIRAIKLAFIGLGIMGEPMARNIIGRGFDVCVCDVDPEALLRFENLNCSVASTPEQAARDRNMVVTMLPTSEIVHDVLFGNADNSGGALSTASPGSLVVDMSTGSLPALRSLIRKVEATTHRIIDAPVGRSKREAVTGNLIAMVGGQLSDIEQARPVLEAVADTIVHVGEVGSGLKLKLVNNFMAMVNHVLTGEVLALAEKAGLNRQTVVDVLSTTSAGKGQLLTNYPKKVLAGDVTPDFSMIMGIKDLRMVMEMAADANASAMFAALSLRLFSEASAAGHGNQDCTAVLHHFEKLNRVVAEDRPR